MTVIDVQGVVDKLEADQEKYAEALTTCGKCFDDAYQIFNEPDFESKKDWRVEIDTEEVKVYSKYYPFGNALVPASVDDAFKTSYNDFESMPTWNSNMSYAKVITKLTPHVDILHYANPDVMIVKSRDYVVGRLWRKVGDQYYCTARSVEIDDLPETPDHVRGEVFLGCGRFSPEKSDPKMTQVDFLLCIDLKGMVPKTIINAVLGKMMVKDFEETLKRHNELMANSN
uniref:START domain-containing protein n=1 Tax=Panagrolaimus sp. ES5 TaxID=591445 RepID=A0AC34G8E7_9BILA